MLNQALKWLYIDFNSYFASVEQQLQPHLRGKPIAIVPVNTLTTSAIAASYEAKAFGIKTGTPIYEARKKCPELICVLARHEAYVEFHNRIMVEINNHVPVSTVCSIDEAACLLMKNEASVEAVTRIAMSIKQGLAKNLGEYIRCSIGVASNRYLAKVATDLQKPDGFTVLLPNSLPERLLELELRDLPGIGRNMEVRLNKAGITTMKALMQLSPEHMRDIWGGVIGIRMWHLLRGADLPEIETKRSSIGHSHVMAPDLRVPSKAFFVARRLTLKAASRLRRMDYYASHLSFSARLEGSSYMEKGRYIEDHLSCWRAQDNMTFLHMLTQIWRRMIYKLRASGVNSIKIKKISITLHGLVPASELVTDLLSDETNERYSRVKHENISHAMDKLNQRFGRDTILIGMLPSQGRSFSGTKIAFTRIPDMEEFLE
jgi:DNA polymerase IV